MLTFEELGELLDELAEEFPPEFFAQLNGGINLLPMAKQNEEAGDGEVYTMGTYCRDSLGRYINIYYGSIAIVCKGYSSGHLRDRMHRLLSHELTHHIESLAGERTLELRDEEQMERYRNGRFGWE